MINYGLTESTIKPEYFSQDNFFIYIASDIKEIIKENFEKNEEDQEVKKQVIYQYNLKRYDKSEYFIEENKKRMQDLTDLEILVYEKVGV